MTWKDTRAHFERIAPLREYWEKKNRYYYAELSKFLERYISPGKRVLEIGCGRGSLLKNLRPSFGVGIDLSFLMLDEARKNFPQGYFVNADGSDCVFRTKFDFIILSDLLGHIEDIQKLLGGLKSLCHDSTRVVITYYNFIWEPVFRLLERFGLKMPQPRQSWLSYNDVSSFLVLAGLEAVKRGRFMLFPKYIPLLSRFINRFVANLSILNHLCILQFWIAKLSEKETVREDASVSVIVPARNEAGNIEPIVRRIPDFGKGVEIIFVEGHSKDQTEKEILKVINKYPQRDIKLYKQAGKGKADAVYTGMDKATGEVLMILDADMTVAPEELPKFYSTLIGSNADIVIGSRLVYPMENKAMRFLNLLGNKAFSVIISWLVSSRIKDTLCGTKVLYMKRYLQLKDSCQDLAKKDPFGDFFFILASSKNACKIVEIPVRYRERSYGTTQISRFTHGFYLLKMCVVAALKIKFV